MNLPHQAPPPSTKELSRLARGRAFSLLSRRTQWVGSLAVLLVLAGLAGLTWHLTQRAGLAVSSAPPSTSAGGGGRGGSTVGVATAERASVPIVLEALGTAVPLASVKVRPQVSGVLEKIGFKEGQMVRAGELLATLDARQFELVLAQATGQRQRDTAQLENARTTLARLNALLAQDSVARQEVDLQAALVKQLEGAVMANNAAVGLAQLNLSHTRITAPVSGRLGLRMVDVGNTVSSSDTNAIVVITQIMPMDVVFAVPQDQLNDVLKAAGDKGQAPLLVTAFDRTRTHVLASGVFLSLDNQIDPTTGTAKAKARFTNADSALFVNQFVNIELRLKSIDNAVVVPIAAVRLGGAGDYVYVLNAVERTVSLRPITRGPAVGDKTVVAAGLKAGEQVITAGADRLKDGSRVTLATDAPRGGGRATAASAAPGSGSGAPTLVPPPPPPPPPPPASASLGEPATPVGNNANQARPASAVPASAAALVTAPQVQVMTMGPSPEQRQRMLEQVKDDPVALERRKKFLEKLDSGDPEALTRWHAMAQKRSSADQSAQRAAP